MAASMGLGEALGDCGFAWPPPTPIADDQRRVNCDDRIFCAAMLDEVHHAVKIMDIFLDVQKGRPSLSSAKGNETRMVLLASPSQICADEGDHIFCSGCLTDGVCPSRPR